ncbi:hypothetical protein [Merismopedia glauca]|uniref:Uncharacterized protein n=1 Tax=Merismopedia glauca CCAP 1448/3 TaxID=1296344 RepID=A0A2T1BXW4_9CYAN|nr:hypothetical protein [Merismopedia glauca]PSB00832.1 hypothetical protein C7B64_21405 [Merismopedia glauca CCAP 1448/3]
MQTIKRKTAVLILSNERGRDPGYPLDPSCISKWCADLGFPPKLREFNRQQFDLLRQVNLHYASGKSREELIPQIRSMTENGHN